MRYLLVGATGNIGARVTQRLIARGERPSVFVRDAKKAKALFGDQVEIRVGDLEKPRSSLAAALTGIDGVFLVTDGPDLDTRDRTVAFAARSGGVRHVVKLSTLDVHTGGGTGPWHARGEIAVRESGSPTSRRMQAWCAGPVRARTRTSSSTSGERFAKAGWPRLSA